MERNRQGFTLIEVVFVVAIIGILAWIAIPNYVRMQDRAREEAVVNNAHTMQRYVEVWKIENGKYPTRLEQHTIPNIRENPFGGAAVIDVPHDERSGDRPGVCYYERSGDPQGGYRITAIGKEGQVLLELTDVTY